MKPARIHNTVLDCSAIVVQLMFSAVALGGVLDPTSATDQADWWPGVVFVVGPFLLAARGLAIGVVVRESEVLLRGWFRTRRFARHDIHGVETAPYSGIWNRNSESRLFRMLIIKTTRGRVELPAMTARSEKAERLALRLSRELALAE